MGIAAEPPAAEPVTPEAVAPEPLPPSDVDLIAASRSGDAAADAALCKPDVAAPKRRPGGCVPALPAARRPPRRLRPAPRRTQAARQRRYGSVRSWRSLRRS